MQKSLGFFMAALRAKKDGDTVFEIKKGFVDGNKVEHLWIREARLSPEDKAEFDKRAEFKIE